MLTRLIQFALAQRLFILIMTVILAAGGWYAFKQLPIDAFPDVSSTQVKIIMKAPGMTPEEIESRIAVPIEVEMLGIPNQKILRSVTKYGLVDVTVDFQDGTDIYWARQQVSERLNNIMADLPTGISGGMAPIPQNRPNTTFCLSKSNKRHKTAPCPPLFRPFRPQDSQNARF